jgi:hypothetical protein
MSKVTKGRITKRRKLQNIEKGRKLQKAEKEEKYSTVKEKSAEKFIHRE